MSDEAYAAFLQRSIEVTHPLGSSLKRVAQPTEAPTATTDPRAHPPPGPGSRRQRCQRINHDRQPWPRWEVAELAAFLCSEKAAFITGECIAIDGGRQQLGAR
jgi:NAD(P)-dependent dehydrogenase (short-subunit alcohol dehydrogenase family)